jgi:glyoxylase-like metal-dependent hydrolase (beta-lactamase superfamily II)
MFSGDTLFARSVGRTDMPDGNYDNLMYSMTKIKDLGGNLRILPGHMCETSLDSERKYNPYLIGV